jgi:cyclohexanone monooxygenase
MTQDTLAAAKPDWDVVVVGAGFSGLYAVHRLRQEGMTVRAFEKGSGIGGTWFWNTYPGARCDIESIDYQYSFSPDLLEEWSWSERYATQPEILSYIEYVADRFGLRDHIQLNTEITGMTWDEDRKLWEFLTEQGEAVTARFAVMASGGLTIAQVPDIEGVSSFGGTIAHTSQWPEAGVELAGKRVAVIGTGSSGLQVIPAAAEVAQEVIVLQRTPGFAVAPFQGEFTPEVAAEERAQFAERRYAARSSILGLPTPMNPVSGTALSPEQQRVALERYWGMGGLSMLGVFSDVMLSPDSNEIAADFVRDRIRAVVKDPDTAEKLIPRDYPLGTKRLGVDRGYYETYNRDNVTLIDVSTTPIEKLTERGLVVDGHEYEVDVIVFATGFDAFTGALLKIDPVGREGARLSAEWSAGPETYLGLAVAKFPNLFMSLGPGSAAALSNAILTLEQQIDWIVGAITRAGARGWVVLEAEESAQREWTATVAQIAQSTLMPRAKSWYTGANVPGKPQVVLVFLGGVVTYEQICDGIASAGYPGFTRTALTGASAPTPHLVSISADTALEVLDVGSGKPLVLVCGTGQDLRMYASLIDEFAGTRRVIAYNHRGIGASTRGAGPISVESLAEDLVALMDALSVDRADILGWSLGSAVAQAAAIAHPDRIESLVLASTWARTSPFQQAILTALRHPWTVGDRAAAIHAMSIAYSQEFVNSPAFPMLMAGAEPLLPSTPEAIQAVLEQWGANLVHDTVDRLPQITARTLVLAAEHDILTPPTEGRMVSQLIPGATLHEFKGPGSSHTVHMERRAEFMSVVRSFLQDAEPAGEPEPRVFEFAATN